MKNETLQENHLNFGTANEAQNFRIQKDKQHRIMEERISFQKPKKKKKRNVLASKITTCERFQKVNNDT